MKGMSPRRRVATLAFGVLAYLASQLVLAYTFGFVGGMLTPTSLDGPARSPLATAVFTDLALLAGFGLQHSLMARRGCKRRMARLGPGVERPAYVLASSLALALLYAFWQPLPAPVWDWQGSVAGGALAAASLAGWVAVLAASLAIGHFHLFGLTDSWSAFRGRPAPPQPLRARALYRHVRHPMYLGTLLAFWCAPLLTWGRVLFAAAMTAYVLLAVRWEERDLLAEHGQAYAEYCRRVPRFVPSLVPARFDDTAPDAGAAGRTPPRTQELSPGP